MKHLKRALVMLCVFVLVYLIHFNGELVKAEDACEPSSIKIYFQDSMDVLINTKLNFDGVVVKDNCGTELDDKVITNIIYDHVDSTIEKSYNVLITAFHQDNGWEDSKVVVVNVKADVIKPVINGVMEKYYFTLNSEITDENFLDGVTVSDNLDNEIDNEDIEVTLDNVDVNTVGIYDVIFEVTDGSNNTEEIKAQVVIVEELPKFIYGDEIITVEVYSNLDDIEQGFYAEFEDEKLGLELDEKDLNLDKLGTYNISFTARVYNLYETKDVEVSVVDTIKPEIKGLRKVEIKKGQYFNPETYLKTFDNYDDDVELIFKGDYDTNKPGVYYIDAIATDESGNESTVTLTLTVVKNNNTLLWVSVILGTGIIIGSAALYYIRKKRIY